MIPADYPLAPPSGEVTVEIDMDGVGRTIYRHAIYTEWRIVPDE